MAGTEAKVHIEFQHEINTAIRLHSALLTSQLSSDALEWQLSELLDERSELGAADQFMFTIVQLVHRHQPIGQNSLH